MYEDDWLMRQFRQLALVVANLARGERVEEDGIEAAVREATGMEATSLDALAPEALAGLLIDEDPRSRDRLLAVAQALEASNRPDRRAKGRWLRERLSAT